MTEKKDKFRVVQGYGHHSMKWLKLGKALSHFDLEPSQGRVCQLFINSQLVLQSRWNPDRYRHDGWDGFEVIMFQNCPREYYPTLVKYLKAMNGYTAAEAKRYHDKEYWKGGLGNTMD